MIRKTYKTIKVKKHLYKKTDSTPSSLGVTVVCQALLREKEKIYK